jgi:hypothetical protein
MTEYDFVLQRFVTEDNYNSGVIEVEGSRAKMLDGKVDLEEFPTLGRKGPQLVYTPRRFYAWGNKDEGSEQIYALLHRESKVHNREDLLENFTAIEGILNVIGTNYYGHIQRLVDYIEKEKKGNLTPSKEEEEYIKKSISNSGTTLVVPNKAKAVKIASMIMLESPSTSISIEGDRSTDVVVKIRGEELQTMQEWKRKREQREKEKKSQEKENKGILGKIRDIF